MKINYKELIIRVIILMVGLAIAHLGVTLFLLADMGADPFNVLVQGIFRSLQPLINLPFFSHGNTHMCVCFIIIFVLLIVDRSYIKIGTVLCMVFGGPIIDVYSIVLGPLFDAIGSPYIKLIMLALGCVILAYGMTIVIKSDAGAGPNDLVAIVISDKSHIKFSIVRTVVDILFVVIGFLLGGRFGIGTIICALLVGVVAGHFLPINERLVNRILKLM